MKEISLLALLFLVFTSTSCKKKNTCYVQDSDKKIIDTIKCDCYKETINELENSPYIKEKDPKVYSISCQED